MNILITGADGMLGSDLVAVLGSTDHTAIPTDVATLDVCNATAVRQAVAEHRVEAVMHLAAMTNVDGCEQEPEAAYRINTLGTRNVALVCQAADVPLVYVSSLSVFGGDKEEAYSELDSPRPVSVYARSKYQGELLVQSLTHRHYIVRAGWMFGGGMEDKKFVAKIIELARERDELTVVDDKFGSPTYTRDLAGVMVRLVESGLYGVYHGVNTGEPVSRFELARAILAVAEIEDCTVRPVSSAHFPLPAPRPRMEAGVNLALRGSGLPEPPRWEESLRRYVRERLLEA